MGKGPCCDKTGLNQGKWSPEEDEKLIKYIKGHEEGTWSWRSLPKSAGLLRCGKSCRLRWMNYLRDDLKRGDFTTEEEDTIVKLHDDFGNRWAHIAKHLPGRSDNEIKNYWKCHLSRRIHGVYQSDGTFKTVVVRSPDDEKMKKKKQKPPAKTLSVNSSTAGGEELVGLPTDCGSLSLEETEW